MTTTKAKYPHDILSIMNKADYKKKNAKECARLLTRMKIVYYYFFL